MDPKGDRLRKIQMGTLKLPDSVLKSTLTTEAPKARGLEGGGPPRPATAFNPNVQGTSPKGTPIILASNKKVAKLHTALPPNVDIPLPLDADIPLPSDRDIPLPATPAPADIPLPRDEDIPLPSDASIPLPADKPPQERKKIKVSLGHLEPKGDELLCRSCVMRFSKQLDYDLHLQSDGHEQAIRAQIHDDLPHGASLLIPRQDRKSPSNDGKSSTVSFIFKKTIGTRLTTQPFLRREDKSDKQIGEIKVLKLEPETAADKVTSSMMTLANSVSNDIEDSSDGLTVGLKDSESKDKVMCSFVKVQSKDDTGKVFDWPKVMCQYTHTEPRIMFSCNPLLFNFSELFINKANKKSPGHFDGAISAVNDDKKDGVDKSEDINNTAEKKDEKKADGEKKKSHKKKKKKKHRKHKDKTDEKEGEEKTEENTGEEGASSKKKKKKKHKKKSEDTEKPEEEKENGDDNPEKEKKKHKKSKKKKHQTEDKDPEAAAGEEEKKSKKRKHSKKSKKKKKKHAHSDTEQEKSEIEKEEEKKKENHKEESDSADESDAEKEKTTKKKHKKKKKHSKKEGSAESSDSENEKSDKKHTGEPDINTQQVVVAKRKFSGAESDHENDKIAAKLQALSRTKVTQPIVPNNTVVQKKIVKKETVDMFDKKTPSDRKRMNSESSVNEQTPTPSKKAKGTVKTPTGAIDKTPKTPLALLSEIKPEKVEESWSKIETQTNDNVKSKWDTSESDIENALDEATKKQKLLKKRRAVQGPGQKPLTNKDLKSPPVKVAIKQEVETRKPLNPSSQRSNKSNISAGSAKKLPTIADKQPVKTRKVSRSPASSHSSRSRSRSYRSYSRSSSRSRSYSSSSYYSDRSRRSKRRRKRRRSSSYSSSSSRSRSRSYHRRRSRSSSYSYYSRSRSYSSSRSRSRSRRKRRRSYSKGRSRSYSSSSYSSRSRSRSRSHRRSRRKHRRKTKSRDRTLSRTAVDVLSKKKVKEELKETASKKVDPSDIPLPDLSGKKDDEITEEKLQKLKEKKPRTDVGKTVAKLVESLPADIPLPFSEGTTGTVSSDSLPSGPPNEQRKETDTGFIGPRLPPPPPPPPGHNMGPPRYPPNHGPPGPPRPGYGPGQWDHWEGHGHWDGGHGMWDGPPGPGPRGPPYRGMRPPFDPRMRGPYDPRMRGPPSHYMNRPPRGPYMGPGPRYPGHHGHPSEYDAPYDTPYDTPYDSHYPEEEVQEPPKKESPPPLPPPKAPSPKPPPPTKKEKEKDKEPEQNPDIVIPPEQAEQYKHLQKQAAKHARRQIRRQQKKELGEPEEDTSSSEEEPEEKHIVIQAADEESVLVEEMQQQLVAVPQQMPLVLAQPQPASSPAGYVIAASSGQQIFVQKQPNYIQTGVPIQAGQPVIAVSQGATILANAAAAAANAQPAHIMTSALGGHLVATPSGVPVAVHSAASLQHLQQVQQLQQIQHMQQVQQQVQQAQQIQQIQQAQAIQAHNQAVAAAHAAQAHGPIIVGSQVLVPRIGIRPAI